MLRRDDVLAGVDAGAHEVAQTDCDGWAIGAFVNQAVLQIERTVECVGSSDGIVVIDLGVAKARGKSRRELKRDGRADGLRHQVKGCRQLSIIRAFGCWHVEQAHGAEKRVSVAILRDGRGGNTPGHQEACKLCQGKGASRHWVHA